MRTLQIEIPDEPTAASNGENLEALIRRTEALAREALMVRLYELGRISTGRGARLLGISRREFLDLLGRHNVSEYDENTDLMRDLQNAEKAQLQRQAGAFADDETLEAVRNTIYASRGRSEAETSGWEPLLESVELFSDDFMDDREQPERQTRKL